MDAAHAMRFDEIGLRLRARAISVRAARRLIGKTFRALERASRFWRQGGSNVTVQPGERIIADIGLLRGDFVLTMIDPVTREDIPEIATPIDAALTENGAAPRPTNEDGARRAA